MFTSLDGSRSGYTTLTPYILAKRHVSPPSILENNPATPFESPPGWPSPTDVLTGMDGIKPAYTALMPSTSR